jgi:molybdopterin molybdotransferase
MDGYAARNDDLRGEPPIVLRVIDEIAAGGTSTSELTTGECARIFTGAPVPAGTDCVVRQEDVTRVAATEIHVNNLRDAGKNVRRRGEDIRKGDVALLRHQRIGPAQLGVLVSLARADVRAYRTPTVALLASGDEIVDLDRREEVLAGEKIATSNTYTLSALIKEAGGQVKSLGIAHDDPADLKERLMRAEGADLIVTTAGISVGEHDYLHQVLDDLDVTEKSWRIQMRPGAPVGFGLVGALKGIPWIGLPGNPVSTMVTFELFVRPAIRTMCGLLDPFRRTVAVVAGERIALGPRLRHFLRGGLSEREDEGGPQYSARLTGPQGSGILTSMSRADALLIVPEGLSVVEVGTTLQAIVLNDPVHVRDVPF